MSKGVKTNLHELVFLKSFIPANFFNDDGTLNITKLKASAMYQYVYGFFNRDLNRYIDSPIYKLLRVYIMSRPIPHHPVCGNLVEFTLFLNTFLNRCKALDREQIFPARFVLPM